MFITNVIDSQLLKTTTVAYQSRPLAVVDPPLRGEVGRLCTVEAVVETSVVAERERDDELSSLLNHLQGGATSRVKFNIK